MAGLFEISSDDLEFHELCDGGNYGCVYRGMWKSRGREVAVKKVLTLGKEVITDIDVCIWLFVECRLKPLKGA